MKQNLRHYLQVLRVNEAALRARGVKSVSIFGSVARGEASATSDIDLLIEIETTAHLGFSYFSLPQYFEELLGTRADVVTKSAVKSLIRERILNDAVVAF